MTTNRLVVRLDPAQLRKVRELSERRRSSTAELVQALIDKEDEAIDLERRLEAVRRIAAMEDRSRVGSGDVEQTAGRKLTTRTILIDASWWISSMAEAADRLLNLPGRHEAAEPGGHAATHGAPGELEAPYV
jgi:hypothetical protein